MNQNVFDMRTFLWNEDHRSLVARQVLRLAPGRSLLDVGCGQGHALMRYAQHLSPADELLGVDLDDEAIAAARAEAARRGQSNLRFEVADACDLPVPDAHFDRVVCQTLLMHLPDADAALDEMLRVLKPGGWLVCMEPDMLLSSLSRYYPDLDDEEWMERVREKQAVFSMLKRRGRGDFRIGRTLAERFARRGLADIGVRLSDAVYQLIPPYGEAQQGYRDFMRKSLDKEAVGRAGGLFAKDMPAAAPADASLPSGLGEQRAEGRREALDQEKLLTHVSNMLYIVSARKEDRP